MAIGAANPGLITPARPLARPSSGSQVAAWIRARILDGSLVRGDRVVQEDVARELGVSRIPVREALVTLDLEGWVAVEPHRGAFVRGVDAAWVQDHYEVLGVLYGRGAQWAALRSDAADRARLRSRARELAAATDLDEFDACNHAVLHDVLVMARSPRLGASLRAAGSIVPGNFFAAVPDTVAPQRAGIAATADAIDARDAATARAALESLVTRQGDAVVAHLSASGVLDVEAG